MILMRRSKWKYGCWDSATSHGPLMRHLDMSSSMIQNPPFGTFSIDLICAFTLSFHSSFLCSIDWIINISIFTLYLHWSNLWRIWGSSNIHLLIALFLFLFVCIYIYIYIWHALIGIVNEVNWCKKHHF
jgi:hypothetical protein